MPKKTSEIDKAIEEAIQFGFTKQLILVNGTIEKLFSNKVFFREEFAIVKTYPIIANRDYQRNISYVVLSDCTLGYVLKERKKRFRKSISVEKHARFEI